MKILKPVLWMLIGVAIGAAAIGSTPSVQAEQQTAQGRFKWVIVPGPADGRRAAVYGRFIHDTVSKGCWLVLVDNNDHPQALSTAPQVACD